VIGARRGTLVLLAARGCADTELRRPLQRLGGHWRLRSKRSFWLMCRVQEYVEYMRAGAEEDSISGSKDSAYLFAVEHGDQFVGDAKLPAFQSWWDYRVNGFKLFRGIRS
jgi:hypothetical protein